MCEDRKFNINIFVAEGRSDGLRIVTKTGWNGIGIVCPRSSYMKARERGEFKQCGVYVLLGEYEDNDTSIIYIGETDKVRQRLDKHYQDEDKDFWQQAIIFTSQGNILNKAQVKYLEAELVKLARGNKRKRYSLKNTANPKHPHLSESAKAEIEWYFEEMKSLFPTLGVMAFEKPKATTEVEYRLIGDGFHATGFETSGGFTVSSGSITVPELQPHVRQKMKGLVRVRQELISDGVLEKISDQKGYRFTFDYEFKTPSMAAKICMGRSANGKLEWKDEKGVSFGEHHRIIEESSDENIKEDMR